VARVAVGGAFGAAVREAVEKGIPTPAGGFPVATLLINLVGAFLLGALVEALVRRGTDVDRRRHWRLLLGTGFLGGFTTYSTFAVETDLLVRGGQPLTAVGYLAATVVGGLVASGAGIVLSARGVGWRQSRLPVDPDADALELDA
jgi:CrcB protein